MISTTRGELLDVLAELGAVHPEMRFGQLVANLASLVDLGPGAVREVEDRDLLQAAREHLLSQVRTMDAASRP